jgi:AraC-like DNA-binding protein
MIPRGILDPAGFNRGILDPAGFNRHISFRIYAPSVDLSPFIEHFWSLSWDIADPHPYISEQVMHRPYVDLFFSRSESGIQCTFRNRRDYQAAGIDRIVGARLRPGAFHAFRHYSLAGLKDQTIDLQQVFPEADGEFAERLLSLDDGGIVEALTGLLLAQNPRSDPNIELVNDIIGAIEENDSLQTVKDVARHYQRSERWIQQLFQEYAGIGLKWLLQRNRLLGAAEQIRETDHQDFAALAYDLGYSSQQHFITHFRDVLGKTPLQYKRELGRRAGGAADEPLEPD